MVDRMNFSRQLFVCASTLNRLSKFTTDLQDDWPVSAWYLPAMQSGREGFSVAKLNLKKV